MACNLSTFSPPSRGKLHPALCSSSCCSRQAPFPVRCAFELGAVRARDASPPTRANGGDSHCVAPCCCFPPPPVCVFSHSHLFSTAPVFWSLALPAGSGTTIARGAGGAAIAEKRERRSAVGAVGGAPHCSRCCFRPARSPLFSPEARVRVGGRRSVRECGGGRRAVTPSLHSDRQQCVLFPRVRRRLRLRRRRRAVLGSPGCTVRVKRPNPVRPPLGADEF